jgi:hypothetical protein
MQVYLHRLASESSFRKGNDDFGLLCGRIVGRTVGFEVPGKPDAEHLSLLGRIANVEIGKDPGLVQYNKGRLADRQGPVVAPCNLPGLEEGGL